MKIQDRLRQPTGLNSWTQEDKLRVEAADLLDKAEAVLMTACFGSAADARAADETLKAIRGEQDEL